jgi:hypothetical protein
MSRLILGLLYPIGAVRTTKYEKGNLVLIPEKRTARAALHGMHHVSRSAVHLARRPVSESSSWFLGSQAVASCGHLRPGQDL